MPPANLIGRSPYVDDLSIRNTFTVTVVVVSIATPSLATPDLLFFRVVFSSHSFWTSSSSDVPAGVTQEGHTGFLIHLLSAVRAFIFLARRIPPFLSLVDRVCVCFLPIRSGHQISWTYQPGSHRRKVTQDFSSTFFLRCVPSFFSREGFSHSFPSSTVISNFVY